MSLYILIQEPTVKYFVPTLFSKIVHTLWTKYIKHSIAVMCPADAL